MPSIDGFPVPVAGRKITPGSASPGPPQNAVDDQPVIPPPAATPRRPIRQQRLQPHPFPIGQIMTIKHDKVLPAHPLKIHETRPSPTGGNTVREIATIWVTITDTTPAAIT